MYCQVISDSLKFAKRSKFTNNNDVFFVFIRMLKLYKKEREKKMPTMHDIKVIVAFTILLLK